MTVLNDFLVDRVCVAVIGCGSPARDRAALGAFAGRYTSASVSLATCGAAGEGRRALDTALDLLCCASMFTEHGRRERHYASSSGGGYEEKEEPEVPEKPKGPVFAGAVSAFVCGRLWVHVHDGGRSPDSRRGPASWPALDAPLGVDEDKEARRVAARRFHERTWRAAAAAPLAHRWTAPERSGSVVDAMLLVLHEHIQQKQRACVRVCGDTTRT